MLTLVGGFSLNIRILLFGDLVSLFIVIYAIYVLMLQQGSLIG